MHRRGIGLAVLLFSFTIANCNSGSVDDTENTHTPEQVQQADTSRILCDTLLARLIQSTDIPDEYKELKIEHEQRRDGSLSVRLYRVDDYAIKTVSVTLTINARERKFYNLTERTGPPQTVRCDTNILNQVIAHCMK